MFKGNWSNGFASGIIVTALLAVLITLFISHGYDGAGPVSYAVDQAANEPDQCYDGNKPVWGPWFGLCFGLFDSLAQWLMMAFTIVATGLLLGTLWITQGMAWDTRRIGEAQARAYLSVVDFYPDGETTTIADNGTIIHAMYRFKIRVLNSGNSPARRVKIKYSGQIGGEDFKEAIRYVGNLSVGEHVIELMHLRNEPLPSKFVDLERGAFEFIVTAEDIFDARIDGVTLWMRESGADKRYVEMHMDRDE